MSDPSDEDLLARVAVGDGGAFETLMGRHLAAIGGYVRRMLGPVAADDVTQECFLRIWRSAAGARRRRRRGPDVANRPQSGDRPFARGQAPCRPGQRDPGRGPPRAGGGRQRHEVAVLLRREIAALPARQRAALALVHDQELPAAEAAAILEVSVAALESLLARARRRLRVVLGDLRKDLVE